MAWVMSLSESRSPVLRESPLPFEETKFSIIARRYLEVPARRLPADVWETIESRSSRYALQRLGQVQLSELLWFTAKTRSRITDHTGVTGHKRPAPSAGARHPVDILVVEDPGNPTLAVYDPVAHALCDLEIGQPAALGAIVEAANAVARNSRGAICLYVANFNKTCAKYEHGESLVWRDSGALLAMFYIVAEALGLGCCGIGITGEPWASSCLNNQSGVQGVGGCIVGERPRP